MLVRKLLRDQVISGARSSQPLRIAGRQRQYARHITIQRRINADDERSRRLARSAYFAAFLVITFGNVYLASRPSQRLLLDSGESSFWSGLPSWLGGSDDEETKKSETQSPPPQTRVATDSGKASDTDDDAKEDDFFTGLWKRVNISDLGDKIGDAILPSWFKSLPGYIRKLQAELSFAPGSLAEEIWFEANDVEINPEIMWDAQVRVSKDLCTEEQIYIRKRKHYIRRMLAKYIDVPLEEIHLEDIPTIAICGSGGGLRAMVAGTSSLLSTAEAGLYDCATYTAGVSGSCWAQALFYSSIGKQDHGRMIEHLKHRLGIHIAFPPAALNLVSSAPTNKYLLSGMVEKLKGLPETKFGLVDAYGILLAGRLLVPKGDLSIDYDDLKVSNQRRFLEHGEYPLPIYTAVRHEIPKDAAPEQDEAALAHAARKEAWFQWLEWSPFEFFCEELDAGIPTWAVGRKFDRGHTSWRNNGLALPELRLPILMGVWGSAFCATVSHYYKEVRPVVKGLIGFRGIDELIAEKDEDLVKLHPIEPATIPNYAYNMRDMLPSTCPESIHGSENLQLMDAGMSNNLPIYPLLRPGRDVDIIIAFDASADVKNDNWLKVTDGYVKQRGIKGWPMGAGWPPKDESSIEAAQDLEEASVNSPEEASKKLDDAKATPDGSKAATNQATELGYCTVWVGSKQERTDSTEPPLSKQAEEEWELSGDEAGIAVVYFPLMANDAVPGVDPQLSEFLSTWNFVYSAEEIDKVVDLARANFEAGKEQTRRTVKAVWQRKRKQRLEREREMRESRWALSLEKARRRSRYGDQGDHFS